MKKINLVLFSLLLVGAAVFYACKKSAKDTSEGSTTARAVTFGSLPSVFTVNTFNKEPIANAAVVSKKFSFPVTPTDLTNVKKILMRIKLSCPSGGCPPWDVFANVRLMKSNGNDSKIYGYELGRWITPYRRDNSSINGGWVVDVTDFRSLLVGDVTLETRAEVYSGTWLVSVDFEYTKGAPAYAHSAVVPVIEHNAWSAGITFGKGTVTTNTYNGKQLGYAIKMPSNAQRTSFRTIISGWGHAQPYAQENRGFCEWAYRTHNIAINGVKSFSHAMTSLGCETNPKVVKDQAGNWTGNRAGWCPGMEVPVRTNVLQDARPGVTFNFNYVLQEDQWKPSNMTEKWRDNGVNTLGAFYSLSTYLVVESSTAITTLPVVTARP